jgi:hypothetical protein
VTRRATKPQAKIAATLRAKAVLPWGFVAHSVEYPLDTLLCPCGSTSRLAPGQNGSWQTVFYPTVWSVTLKIFAKMRDFSRDVFNEVFDLKPTSGLAVLRSIGSNLRFTIYDLRLTS